MKAGDGRLEWLFEVGAKAGFNGQVSLGSTTPLSQGNTCGSKNALEWLVMAGAATDSSGHISTELVKRDLAYNAFCHYGDSRRHLLTWAKEVLMVHRIFLDVVLLGSATRIHQANNHPASHCFLDRLAAPLFELISDFLGVERGRRL